MTLLLDGAGSSVDRSPPATRPFPPRVRAGFSQCRRYAAGLLCLLSTGMCAAWPLMFDPQVSGLTVPPAPADKHRAARAQVPLAEVPRADVIRPADEHGRAEQTELRRRYQTALELFDDGQFEQAATELDAALDLSPAPDYELLCLLARVKLALRRPGEARLAAEQAVAAHAAPARAHVLLARMHRARGRQEAALAHFRSATLAAEREPDRSSGPDDTDAMLTAAWYELGECLAEAGYTLAAVEAFEHFDSAVWVARPEQRQYVDIAAILKQNPYGAIERRLELLGELDRPEELIRAAERACKERPSEPYLERLYVRTLLEQDRAAEAFEFCRQRLLLRMAAMDADPDEARSATLLTLAIDTGKAAGRLTGWVGQLRDDVAAGQHFELAGQLASRLDAAGDQRLSIPLWAALAAVRERPEEENSPGRRLTGGAAAWALATALKDSGDVAAALGSLIEYVRNSAAANPAAADIPPERLAAWMRGFEATDDFLSLVHELSARPDSDFAACTVLGATAAAANQTELAERLFTAALEDRPDFALAHVAWGRMLLANWRWEEASTHASQALEIAPDLPAAHFLRAEAYQGLDMHDKAEAGYKMAVELRPSEATYVLALARHYRQTGNLLAAQRYLQQVWSTDRSLGDAVEELIDSYLEGGKLEIARACLREAEASDLGADTLRRIGTTLQFAAAPMRAEHLTELERQLAAHRDDVRTALKLAAGLYLNHRERAALPVLLQARQYAPDDQRLMHLLARVHMRQLQGERAIAILEETTRRHPRRLAALRLLADAYLAEFRVDEARRTLRRVLELDLAPEQQQQVRAALMATFVEFGEFAGALEQINNWLSEQPDSDLWARARLRTLLAAERYDEAVDGANQRLGPVTRAFEQRAADFKALAALSGADGENAEAQARLKALERELSGAAGELYQRRSEYVQTCLEAGRFDLAEGRIRQWLSEDTAQPSLWEWLVETLLAANKPEESLTAVGKLTPQSPMDVLEALIWRARCYARTGRLEDAVSDLNSLLEEGFIQESPLARSRVRQEILSLLVDTPTEPAETQRNADRALELCQRWLDAAGAEDRVTRFEILTLRRSVLGAAGRLDEQVAVAQALLEMQPYDAGLNNDLGYTWADRGEQLDRAVEMVALAVAAEPLNPAFLDSLGWAYYKRGDFDAARLYLKRSVRLYAGQDPLVYDHLGDAEYRLGDSDAARREWARARALLEEREGAIGLGGQVELLASLRSKLSALELNERPRVAPTAAEQTSDPGRESGDGAGPAAARSGND